MWAVKQIHFLSFREANIVLHLRDFPVCLIRCFFAMMSSFPDHFFSIGITAIELADGEPPLWKMHPVRALFQIVHNPPPEPKVPSEWSTTFRDFLSEYLWHFCLLKGFVILGLHWQICYITRTSFAFATFTPLCNNLIIVVSRCLIKNPDHRPVAMELFEHPFIQEIPEDTGMVLSLLICH